MAILATTSPSGAAIRAGRKTLARVKADKHVKDLKGVLSQPQADLKARMNARVDADDANIDAQQECGAREDDLLDALGSLGIKAYGLYEAYRDAGYRRLFTVAPSKLSNLGEDGRRKAYTVTLQALKEETPKELAGAAKAVVTAHGEYEAAYLAAAGSQKALDKAQLVEGASLDEWHTAVRKLKAQITDRFPRDLKRVAKFFQSAVTKKKVKMAVVVPA